MEKGSRWRLNNSSSDPNNQSVNNHTSENLSGSVLSARQQEPLSTNVTPVSYKVKKLKDLLSEIFAKENIHGSK